MHDPFDLNRFLTGQEPHLESVRAELKRGRKVGHWIWFIFPQMRGLGSSWNSKYFGISSRREARAFLQHPILGPRLVEFTGLVNAIRDRSISEILGTMDAQKFRSSMTLFTTVDGERSVFAQALKLYFDGHPDPLTLALIRE